MEKEIRTPYGPVRETVLEELQSSFDTRQLLAAVDQGDRFCAQWREELRDDLLALHAMARHLLVWEPQPAINLAAVEWLKIPLCWRCRQGTPPGGVERIRGSRCAPEEAARRKPLIEHGVRRELQGTQRRPDRDAARQCRQGEASEYGEAVMGSRGHR